MVAQAKRKRKPRGPVKSNSQWITVVDFGREFNISAPTVRRRIKAGVIKTVPFDTADPNAKRSLNRIPQSEVARFKAMAGME